MKNACFVAGTLVHTREGLRPIERIQVGDHVLSKAEDGSGATAYKRVVNTLEFDDQEAWFVSWEDTSLLPKLRIGMSHREYLDAHGRSFVVTTPNHPFWVVESDEENLRYDETYPYCSGPFPKQEWTRADRLAAGMKLLLADGRLVEVTAAKRVYRTDRPSQGWVDSIDDGALGLMIDFENNQSEPAVPVHEGRFAASGPYHGMVANPYEGHADDIPPGSAPDSWYRTKVYNLEVEGFQTYFVDKLGVWVHSLAE